ncbi:MAG TPA: hypothetical protein DDY77_00315 [Clostridiales bacterium]|nr:hypothetical protein [Clostridiales bacterium]
MWLYADFDTIRPFLQNLDFPYKSRKSARFNKTTKKRHSFSYYIIYNFSKKEKLYFPRIKRKNFFSPKSDKRDKL